MVQPAYGFTLPSVEDDTVLDCRLYLPGALSRNTLVDESGIKGAVLAHPYAPLGGSYDDHVVLSTTNVLLEQGYFVSTFNFR
jgi:alpha/beta superfamily hydrolase